MTEHANRIKTAFLDKTTNKHLQGTALINSKKTYSSFNEGSQMSDLSKMLANIEYREDQLNRKRYI